MLRRLAIGAAMILALGEISFAHHSIAAVYDGRRSVTIQGVVSEFHFVNPHPYVVVTVSEPEGISSWHLEMDNRGELASVGMTSQTLRAGDRVSVSGSPSRTERRNLYVRKLVRPADGFEYEQVGSSPRVKQG